jgi:hypothetical protein
VAHYLHKCLRLLRWDVGVLGAGDIIVAMNRAVLLGMRDSWSWCMRIGSSHKSVVRTVTGNLAILSIMVACDDDDEYLCLAGHCWPYTWALRVGCVFTGLGKAADFPFWPADLHQASSISTFHHQRRCHHPFESVLSRHSFVAVKNTHVAGRQLPTPNLTPVKLREIASDEDVAGPSKLSGASLGVELRVVA